MNYYLDLSENEVILYSEQFDEYGIPVCDGGDSFIKIDYCPWCGERLPESKRNVWFDELEKMGFEDPFSQDIPQEYRSGEWYRK